MVLVHFSKFKIHSISTNNLLFQDDHISLFTHVLNTDTFICTNALTKPISSDTDPNPVGSTGEDVSLFSHAVDLTNYHLEVKMKSEIAEKSANQQILVSLLYEYIAHIFSFLINSS